MRAVGSQRAAVPGNHHTLSLDNGKRLLGGDWIIEIAKRDPAGAGDIADLLLAGLQEPAVILGHHQRAVAQLERVFLRPALTATEAHIPGLRRTRIR